MTSPDLRKRPRWRPSASAARDLFYCITGTCLLLVLIAGVHSELDPMVFFGGLWAVLLSLLLGFAAPFTFLVVIFEERIGLFDVAWLLLPLAIGAGIAFSTSIKTRWVRFSMMAILLPIWIVCGGFVAMGIAMG